MPFPKEPKTISLVSGFDQTLANTSILGFLMFAMYCARMAINSPPGSPNRHAYGAMAGFFILNSAIMMALPHIERELGRFFGAPDLGPNNARPRSIR